ARALLEAHYKNSGLELNEARLRMARIPDGATLIENPVSTAPGFTVENVHVMAGVPAVFNAMVESVVPTLVGGPPLLSRSVRINRGEGDIAGPLGELARAFQDLSFGSYPFQRNGRFGANVVIRGHDEALVTEAQRQLIEIFGGEAV
ncbi:MAG: competence/damage-inducible protein A, partial [Pseudomonadota bacterium]